MTVTADTVGQGTGSKSQARWGDHGREGRSPGDVLDQASTCEDPENGPAERFFGKSSVSLF